jgi:drug/metabolite transporter (DMT)-like permease
VICRKLPANDAILTVVMLQQSCALVFALVLLAAAYLIRSAPVAGHVSGWAWVSAIVSGVLYYAVAFGLYLAGLRQVSAAIAGIFLTLLPVFGVIAAYLLLGERLSARQRFGAAVVIAAAAAITVMCRQPAKVGEARPGIRPRRLDMS